MWQTTSPMDFGIQQGGGIVHWLLDEGATIFFKVGARSPIVGIESIRFMTEIELVLIDSSKSRLRRVHCSIKSLSAAVVSVRVVVVAMKPPD
jgi:hypothetical protein